MLRDEATEMETPKCWPQKHVTERGSWKVGRNEAYGTTRMGKKRKAEEKSDRRSESEREETKAKR